MTDVVDGRARALARPQAFPRRRRGNAAAAVSARSGPRWPLRRVACGRQGAWGAGRRHHARRDGLGARSARTCSAASWHGMQRASQLSSSSRPPSLGAPTWCACQPAVSNRPHRPPKCAEHDCRRHSQRPPAARSLRRSGIRDVMDELYAVGWRTPGRPRQWVVAVYSSGHRRCRGRRAPPSQCFIPARGEHHVSARASVHPRARGDHLKLRISRRPRTRQRAGPLAGSRPRFRSSTEDLAPAAM